MINNDEHGELSPDVALFQIFTEFYEQIAQIKFWIVKDELQSIATEKLKLPQIPDNEQIAGAVQLLLMERISLIRRKYQTLFTEDIQQLLPLSLYALVVLADELLLLEIDWPGKAHWQDMLLEQKLFNSSEGGDRLFFHIDKLLSRETAKPHQQTMAAIYLLILRIGFLGRFRDEPGGHQQYAQKLATLISKQTTQKRSCSFPRLINTHFSLRYLSDWLPCHPGINGVPSALSCILRWVPVCTPPSSWEV